MGISYETAVFTVTLFIFGIIFFLRLHKTLKFGVDHQKSSEKNRTGGKIKKLHK